MKASSRTENGVFVISLEGKILGGPESDILSQKVKEAIGHNYNKVVVDMGGVEWMNSSGIGVLMSGFMSVRNAQGTMKLACVNEKVKALFLISKLNTVFTFSSSVEEAIASFK